jgi:hypothetical protein
MSNPYASARPLRTFEHLGETFTVVRWRDHHGKHWRGYTALLHDGQWVGDDISHNRRDDEEPYEAQMSRIFKTREALLSSIAELKSKLEALK